MDNRLNEIRRKISFLRTEMLRFEDTIRQQVNRDEDCSDASMRLMAMRVVMLGLISERNRLGGEERLLNVAAVSDDPSEWKIQTLRGQLLEPRTRFGLSAPPSNERPERFGLARP